MSKIFPENDPDRYRMLVDGLIKTYRALAKQEGFTPHDILYAITNATVLYAASEGFDRFQVLEFQNEMSNEIYEERERRKEGAPK